MFNCLLLIIFCNASVKQKFFIKAKEISKNFVNKNVVSFAGVSIRDSLLRVAEVLGLDLEGVPQALLNASVQKVADMVGVTVDTPSVDLSALAQSIIAKIDEETLASDGTPGALHRAWDQVKRYLLPSTEGAIFNFSSVMVLLGGIGLLLIVRYLRIRQADILDRLSKARGVLEALGVLMTLFRSSRRREAHQADRQSTGSPPESVVIEMEEKPPTYNQAVASTREGPYRPLLACIPEETASLLALEVSTRPNTPASVRPSRPATPPSTASPPPSPTQTTSSSSPSPPPPPTSGFIPRGSLLAAHGGARPKVPQPSGEREDEVRILFPRYIFFMIAQFFYV